MNEVDQAGIEAELNGEKSYLELTEGCVCCVRNPDLIAALTELGTRQDIDRIILETTGLADPLQLAWTVERPELSPIVRLDAIITTLDPTAFERSQTSEWQAQVEAADLAFVTKEDIASEQALRDVKALAQARHPKLRILSAQQPKEAMRELWFSDLFQTNHGNEAANPWRVSAPRHSAFSAHGFSGGRYRADSLELWLEQLPPNVFRGKGVVDTNEGWLRFHVVAGRLKVDLDIAAPAHGETRMSFFGQNVDVAALEAGLHTARL